MCFDTHTEAGRVQKNSTTLELLKAAAGYYFVIQREYKKEVKSRLQAESKQHYAYKQEVSF